MENLDKLVRRLCTYPDETPWLEFKHNNYDPEMIGQDISALANGATLDEKNCAYFVWGVQDGTHDLVGTDKNLQNLKKGNEELENWLRRMLSNNADFEYHTVEMDNVTVGVMIIQCATKQPVTFQKVEYIRVGSYTKKLADYTALQSKLWARLHNVHFEEQPAMQDQDLSAALRLLDYGVYFDLIGVPQPTSADGIVHYMLEEGVLLRQDNGLYTITNMGAILLAKRLADFPKVSRKAIRVIQYDGNNRMHMLKEDIGGKGYVVGFDGLVKYIEALIPTQEVINGALREKRSAYPVLAIREAVANALIHQDFAVEGMQVVVEIFDNRISITNPGAPLHDVNRLLDLPPQSRNEHLAQAMFLLGICERRGSGIDRAVEAIESMLLPAAKITKGENHTRVFLFMPKDLSEMTKQEKIEACYQHACLVYEDNRAINNQSVRDRFGIDKNHSHVASRIIADTLEAKKIKLSDESITSKKYATYIPYYA